MGTPEEAVPSLTRLVRGGVDVAVCVSPPDVPAGRGRKHVEHPVKAAARSLGLKVVPTDDVNALADELRDLRLDAFVVVAFGQILSPTLLVIPRLGAFNLHFSLLPEYRGAAPVQRALMAGEQTTGATVMAMSAEVDAGDIVLQDACPIADADNALTLKTKLAWLGADLLLKALALADKGELPRHRQPSSPTSRARKLKKEELLIRWQWPASRIWGLVRAAAPLPGAFTYLGSKRLKILQGRPVSSEGEAAVAGQILGLIPDGILAATGRGAFLVQEVQPEGGKRMGAAEFLRGARLKSAEAFSTPGDRSDG